MFENDSLMQDGVLQEGAMHDGGAGAATGLARRVVAPAVSGELGRSGVQRRSGSRRRSALRGRRFRARGGPGVALPGIDPAAPAAPDRAGRLAAAAARVVEVTLSPDSKTFLAGRRQDVGE